MTARRHTVANPKYTLLIPNLLTTLRKYRPIIKFETQCIPRDKETALARMCDVKISGRSRARTGPAPRENLLGTCGVCLEVKQSNHVLDEVLESMIMNDVHLYEMWNGDQEIVTLIKSKQHEVTIAVHSLEEP